MAFSSGTCWHRATILLFASLNVAEREREREENVLLPPSFPRLRAANARAKQRPIFCILDRKRPRKEEEEEESK